MFYNLNLSLTATLFVFFSLSPQTFEQKQTPVPPGAPLPVQPQTGTTVSTPPLLFSIPLLLHPSPVLISPSFDVLRDLRESAAAVFLLLFLFGLRVQVPSGDAVPQFSGCGEVRECVRVRVCVCA